MNRREAKKAAKLLKQYSKGAKLQVREDENDEWTTVKDPTFLHIFQWRVKPGTEV
jgi:hypothetical protein